MAGFGVVGNGSWATALVKILTDNGHLVHWWVRNAASIAHIQKRHHNPHYLPAVYFDTALLRLSDAIATVVQQSDVVILAVPSAYVEDALNPLPRDAFQNKNVVSAIKGIVPGPDVLVNEYLEQQFDVPLQRYFAILGPCHAEEVAAEKLSYLTFSGIDTTATGDLANFFKTPYINTVINGDILGVQYAAVLKNIYALGAGIAHGLEYGDNFLSVYIANSADEMAGFLRKAGMPGAEAGEPEPLASPTHAINYAASVYLGDLLVTCYSLYSRNRTFGAMIGKGYTVQAAQLEMNMVAEGHNAAKCIYHINRQVGAAMPIAETIYRILWERLQPARGFDAIESVLV